MLRDALKVRIILRKVVRMSGSIVSHSLQRKVQHFESQIHQRKEYNNVVAPNLDMHSCCCVVHGSLQKSAAFNMRACFLKGVQLSRLASDSRSSTPLVAYNSIRSLAGLDRIETTGRS